MISHLPRRHVTGVLRILRLTWLQLVAVDLLANAVRFLVIAPTMMLLLSFVAARRGGSVLTDEAIVWFFLSPRGLTALVVVGAVALWIFFIEHGAILAIAHVTSAAKSATSRWAFGVIVRRGAAVLRLTAAMMLGLLILVSPFVGLMAVVYATLLTEFDINYYLLARPATFWVAGTLIVLLAVVLVIAIGAMVVRLLFAIPVLLFERKSVLDAIRRSAALSHGHRWSIAAWILAWAVTSLVASTLLTGAVGAIGNLLIPWQSESLEVAALAVGAVIVVAILINVAISVVVSSLLGVIVDRLYVACGGVGLPPELIATRPDARAKQARLQLRLSTAVRVIPIVVVMVAVTTGWVIGTLRTEDTTETTAHRGSSATAPENTLAAVEQAIADGADWIEVDVQELEDGTVVVMHDRDLQRLGGVNVVVASSKYDELRDVDVGSWFAAEYSGERIPTLEQILDLCRGRAGVNIELKYYGSTGTLAERVIQIVEERRMESEVVLMSLKHDVVRQAKGLRPDWKMGVLTAVALGNPARLKADFLAIHSSLATRSLIRSAHRRGREVHVWTVNDPLQMSVLISRGVDNIITDVPAVARSVLEERAAMTAVQRLLVEVGAWLGIVPVEEEALDDQDNPSPERAGAFDR